MPQIEHALLIAGAGPTGLMLAGELASAGIAIAIAIAIAIIERRSNQELAGMRALGLLPRTLELADRRGIADCFVALGKQHPVALFVGTTLVPDL